jgi:hypothetical protein
VGQRLVQQVIVEGILAKRSAQPGAVWLRLACRIDQAASTFSLT